MRRERESVDREKVINKVTAIVADMQEEVDEWKDYSDSELRGGLTCDCDWWCKTLQTLKDALALLKAQELRYTPREVRNVLMEYGQHDLSIGLGKVIKYDPVQVEDILTKARELTKPVIPHMVDWGIYECPKCKTRVDKTYKYCKHCGRPVKWE